MKRILPLIVATCLLPQATASAAAFTAAPANNCKSAYRDPNMDWREALKGCRQTTSAMSPLAGEFVMDNQVPWNQADFTNVPEWSDADIKAQFEATRDARNLHADSNLSFARRVSWLYPKDGCYARAQQVVDMAADAKKKLPYKLFSFGNLVVSTPNEPGGVVTWSYHVVPIVKSMTDKQVYVLDAAIDPCAPMPWKTWLLKQVPTLNDVLVAVAAPYAYGPDSPVAGDDPAVARENANYDEQTQGQFLDLEWDNQTKLGRDPNVVLGATPPWGSGVCVKTVYGQVTIPANSSGTASASCAKGTELAVGGGFEISSDLVQVSKSVMTKATDSKGKITYGWTVTATNKEPQSTVLTVTAQCIYGHPTSAAIIMVTGTAATVHGTNDSPKGTVKHADATAKCTQSGYSTIAGGWSTTAGVNIYNSGKIDVTKSPQQAAPTSSTWTVSANNTLTSDKSLTAYAYCLNKGSVTQSYRYLPDYGECQAWCTGPAIALSGGFMTLQNGGQTILTQEGDGSYVYITDMDYGSGGDPDPNYQGFAQCWTGTK
jgi:hypothetical protein